MKYRKQVNLFPVFHFISQFGFQPNVVIPERGQHVSQIQMARRTKENPLTEASGLLCERERDLAAVVGYFCFTASSAKGNNPGHDDQERISVPVLEAVESH